MPELNTASQKIGVSQAKTNQTASSPQRYVKTMVDIIKKEVCKEKKRGTKEVGSKG